MRFCGFVHWPNIGCKLLLHIRNLIWPNIKLAMKEQIEAEAVSEGQGCVTDCRSGIGLNVRKGVFPSDFLPLQLCLFAVVRGGFEKHSGKHTQIHRHTHTHRSKKITQMLSIKLGLWLQFVERGGSQAQHWHSVVQTE